MAVNLGNISLHYVTLMIDTARKLVSKKDINHPSIDTQPFSPNEQWSTEDAAQELERIIGSFDLPKDPRPEDFISIPKFMRLGKSLMDFTQRPDLGLLMGKTNHVGYFDLVGYAAMTANDLIESHRVIARFEPILSVNQRGQSRFLIEEDTAIAEFYSIRPYNEFNRFVVDLVLSSLFHITNWLAGRDIQPIQIEIEYEEPDYAEVFKAYFPCPVLYGQQKNCIRYSLADLKSPCIYRNRLSYQSALETCIKKLESSHLQVSELDQIKQLLTPMIQGKTPSIEEFAESLGIPSWTLQRKLKKWNVHYKQVVDEVKAEMAINYVRDTDLNLGEIAWRLGFSNPTGFQRAFVRWTGQPPGAYRLSSRQNR